LIHAYAAGILPGTQGASFFHNVCASARNPNGIPSSSLGSRQGRNPGKTISINNITKIEPVGWETTLIR
jgi:hypothetical protein